MIKVSKTEKNIIKKNLNCFFQRPRYGASCKNLSNTTCWQPVTLFSPTAPKGLIQLVKFVVCLFFPWSLRWRSTELRLTAPIMLLCLPLVFKRSTAPTNLRSYMGLLYVWEHVAAGVIRCVLICVCVSCVDVNSAKYRAAFSFSPTFIFAFMKQQIHSFIKLCDFHRVYVFFLNSQWCSKNFRSSSDTECSNKLKKIQTRVNWMK